MGAHRPLSATSSVGSRLPWRTQHPRLWLGQCFTHIQEKRCSKTCISSVLWSPSWYLTHGKGLCILLLCCSQRPHSLSMERQGRYTGGAGQVPDDMHTWTMQGNLLQIQNRERFVLVRKKTEANSSIPRFQQENVSGAGHWLSNSGKGWQFAWWQMRIRWE